MNPDLMPGKQLTDLELPDHNGHTRLLSELAGGDPLVVNFYRGWWCPKEHAFFRRLVALQSEAEVAYTRFVSISVDQPEVAAAFRAGLDARWTFPAGSYGPVPACSRHSPHRRAPPSSATPASCGRRPDSTAAERAERAEGRDGREGTTDLNGRPVCE
jgi:thiol-disulfide isomerase/thioredoxin